VILRFRTDPLLKNTLVLNPEWATEAVYKLIDTPQILKNKGRFDLDDLDTIWDTVKYPVDKHPQLIRLMEKFEISFNFTGTPVYIVPELVPEQRLDIAARYLSDRDALRFQYRYDFMPRGIVSRFIARNYYHIRDENFWQNGVELVFEESSALVMGNTAKRKLGVWVRGPQKTELLAIIRNDLNHIHSTLNMREAVHYKEEIPCPCCQCSESDSPYLFDYPMLLRRRDKGRTRVECGQSDEEVPISRLLHGFVPEAPLEELDFTRELLKATHYLQGKYKNLRNEEDSFTDFISVILEARGLRVDSQGRWGISKSEESIGRPDLRVINPEGETMAIVEAFRLKGRETTVTQRHLQKLFNYDPTGCEVNYILVYVENENFDQLWNWYKEYIKSVDFRHPLLGIEEKEIENHRTVRFLTVRHLRAGRETAVFHIFISLPVPKTPAV
jgi:internalin A